MAALTAEDAAHEPDEAEGLFPTMLDRFSKIGGVELELPPRATPVRAADLMVLPDGRRSDHHR